MIVQAIPPFESPLLQLPYLLHDSLRHFNTKKRAVTKINDLLALPEEERKTLFRTLDDVDYYALLKVAKSIQQIQVSRWVFRVAGEQEITCSSLITLVLELKTCQFDDENKENGKSVVDKSKNTEDLTVGEDDEDESKKKWWEIKNTTGTLVHAPYFPTVRSLVSP